MSRILRSNKGDVFCTALTHAYSMNIRRCHDEPSILAAFGNGGSIPLQRFGSEAGADQSEAISASPG